MYIRHNKPYVYQTYFPHHNIKYETGNCKMPPITEGGISGC
jgi:hypothetical protein